MSLGLPSSPLYSEYSYEVVEALIVKLLEYGLVVAVTYFGGKPWLRISANIYNCKEEFIKMKDILMRVLNIHM